MSPLSNYFGGHGAEVMSNMTSQYGAEKGKQVFYATAQKRKQKPSAAQKAKAKMRPR